jgi:glycerol-3-phosphate acyltransferase PlsX
MKIALDGMGGDHAPKAQVEGAIMAARLLPDDHIIITGNRDLIERELSLHKGVPRGISVEHAPEVVEMTDEPAAAYRQKKKSSLAVAVKLVADGEAGAIVSAGNSGAVMAAALFDLKRIEGISRPALAALFPTLKGTCIILDVGANVDSRPSHLLHFALMGKIYAREALGIADPAVGLVSIGEEDSKGNELTLETLKLIREREKNFVGNIEGRDIPMGLVDVAVCDGFVGNVILKFGEGVGEMLFKLIKQALKNHPVTWLSLPFLWAAMKDLRKKADYSEYGGALLLGVRGACFICHGRSNAKSIKNALLKAAIYAKHDITRKIEERLKEYANGNAA